LDFGIADDLTESIARIDQILNIAEFISCLDDLSRDQETSQCRDPHDLPPGRVLGSEFRLVKRESRED